MGRKQVGQGQFSCVFWSCALHLNASVYFYVKFCIDQSRKSVIDSPSLAQFFSTVFLTQWFMITTTKFTNVSSWAVSNTHLPGDLRVGIPSPFWTFSEGFLILIECRPSYPPSLPTSKYPSKTVGICLLFLDLSPLLFKPEWLRFRQWSL